MNVKPTVLKLNWDQDLPKYYFDNSPFKTHLFNSISIMFEQGEVFFIKSVNYYRDIITEPAQLKNIDNFIKQEAGHTVVHKKYNEWISSHGLPKDYIENITLKHLNRFEKIFGNKGCLVTTTTLEHITAIAAEYVLLHPTVMEKMHPHFREIWEHHSIEEIEHKAVAMSILNKIGSYKFRRFINVIIWGPAFIFCAIANTIRLLRADKQLWKWRTVKDAVDLLFNYRHGIFTKLIFPWMRCLKINFHPNNHDTTLLLQRFAKV
jgi:predicted metal-dependent hydrolase